MMRHRLRELYRAHPMLSAVLSIYLGLSTVELVRILAFDQPTSYTAGFHEWEEDRLPRTAAERRAKRPRRRVPFRWTGPEGALLEPVLAPVVRIPIYLARPDFPSDGVTVTISVDGQDVEDVTLFENGWQETSYFLPPILGEDAWSVVEAARASRSGPADGVDRPAGAGHRRPSWLGGWEELYPWHRTGPPSAWLGFVVDSAFVPASVGDSEDARELGVGVGELQWVDDPPIAGIGFHDWEEFLDGTRFRWTRRLSSQPATSEGERMGFRLRADHPDIDQNPVTVRIYWGARLVDSVALRDRDWLAVELPTGVPAGTSGVVSLLVSHTWSPATSGLAPDPRRLGVAMTAIEWR